MEVILIEDVPTLGEVGEKVAVKPGYARNYLLPKKLAILASTSNAARLAHEQRQVEKRKIELRKADEAVASVLKGKRLSFVRKAGEQDKLFGSVTASDIEAGLAAENLLVDRRKIQLDDPIKTLGEHIVKVKLRNGVEADLKVWVASE